MAEQLQVWVLSPGEVYICKAEGVDGVRHGWVWLAATVTHLCYLQMPFNCPPLYPIASTPEDYLTYCLLFLRCSARFVGLP